MPIGPVDHYIELKAALAMNSDALLLTESWSYSGIFDTI
jgi:hypothetical protein